MKSTTSLVLVHEVLIRVRVRVRIRVRVRVTKLVYQIGFTTPLYVSRPRKDFSSKQQAASSKQQQAATELISAYPHISVSIDAC